MGGGGEGCVIEIGTAQLGTAGDEGHRLRRIAMGQRDLRLGDRRRGGAFLPLLLLLRRELLSLALLRTLPAGQGSV